jgi:hypothetical protein
MNGEGQNKIKFKFLLDDLISPNGVLAALVRTNLIPGNKPVGGALDKLAEAIGIAQEDCRALLLREIPRYYPV